MIKNKRKKKTPFQANQFQLDPRQGLFINYYFTPESSTFSNAMQSAIRAGYSEEYAKNLTGQLPSWLSDKLEKDNIIKIADNNIKDLLQQDDDLKVKADITKFVQARLNKNNYSERTETVNKTTNINIDIPEEEVKNLISSYRLKDKAIDI